MRVALGWSLDDLAERTHLGASTLSRIESGKRTIGIDVLQTLCRALQTDVSAVLDTSDSSDDVIIRPVPASAGGRTVWPLTRNDSNQAIIAAKWRLQADGTQHDPQVHPGRDWFFVLTGTVRLVLGDRTIIVNEGEAAEFSTMTPHSVSAHIQPAEILTIFDRTGHHAHLEKAEAPAGRARSGGRPRAARR